ncbi:MAG TPA: hypothetical protein VNF47_18815 [Streptosporangiaceae bacterium]|nr:hypothetical protein [Streptosporangiaceae bacterium]
MGLMDKVKAQANSLAQSANAGMAKLDALPAQRRADALLRGLGLAVLAERTGRATGDTEAQINQLLAEIAQHEAQNNVNLVQQAAAQAQAQAQQMQTGPGEFLTSSPTATDPNVPGAPPVGTPGSGAPAGFPGAAPTSFPQSGGPAGFPEAAPVSPAPTSFPQSGGPTGFPEASPATSFPAAVPTGFPGTPAPADAAPEQASEQQPSAASDDGSATGFPPATGV